MSAIAVRSSARSSPASASAAAGSRGDQPAQHAGLHGQPGQLRAEPVVQVAPQPAPLLLAGGDQPLARALQVGGQPDGGHRDPGLAREVRQQPPVGGGEAGLARAQPEHELADRPVLVEQRQVDGARRPARRPPPAARRPSSAIAA